MAARVPTLSLLAALTLVVGAPLSAQAIETPSPVDSAIGRAQDAASRQDCAGVLGALDPVLPALQPGTDRTAVQRLRLVCLGAVGRAQELPAVQRELVQALPRDGVVRAFGVLIAADESRFADAADQIASLAATSPRSLDVLTGQAVRAISTHLETDHANDARDRMMIALARADWAPADFPELRTGFAEGAIGALIRQGAPDEAEGLLDRIDQPELLSSMLVDRHYTKLWPAIEAQLGPAGGASVDRFALERLTAFGDSPDSDVALRDAANAMLLLGRYDDVIALTDRVQVADGMSREAVSTLLYRARALAALRQVDAVDRLFSGLMTFNLASAPAASTALVSYAEFLDDAGRPAKGLEVARSARSKASGYLTDLGERWLDRTEVCTLSALGKVAEANQAMDRLKKLADQNPSAVIEALLCARRDAEASQVAIKAFADREAASDLLLQFQPAESTWAPAPSRLRELWVAFLARPEIRAAFDRTGRIMPRAFWPDRAPRSIPRRPSSGAPLT